MIAPYHTPHSAVIACTKKSHHICEKGRSFVSNLKALTDEVVVDERGGDAVLTDRVAAVALRGRLE